MLLNMELGVLDTNVRPVAVYALPLNALRVTERPDPLYMLNVPAPDLLGGPSRDMPLRLYPLGVTERPDLLGPSRDIPGGPRLDIPGDPSRTIIPDCLLCMYAKPASTSTIVSLRLCAMMILGCRLL